MPIASRRAFARLLILGIVLSGCTKPEKVAVSNPPAQQIENLQAFAKLYGYVRFFHPSDEASRIDWDRFAILGASRVRGALDAGELQVIMESLFLPLAPTVQIYLAEGPAPPPLDLVPDGTEDMVVLAWQHRGVGLGFPGPYMSARSNRAIPQSAQSHGFGTVTQGLSAAEHRGREIRLSAAVRAETGGAATGGQLWLRVDRPGRQQGFFDNMGDRPVLSSAWSRYEITGKVDDDAESIYFGCLLTGKGKVWMDDFRLELREPGGSWQAVDIANPGFEAGDEAEGWFAASPGYDAIIEKDGAFAGQRCLRIADAQSLGAAPLFPQLPKVGEVADKAIGGGLRARVPLALFGSADAARGDDLTASLQSLLKDLDAVDIEALDASDVNLRLGGVITAWNVFQHFYPYFDLVDVDWDAVLRQALAEALAPEDDEIDEEYANTLKRLVVKLQDGHGRVQDEAMWEGKAWPPFLADWIEDEVVVTRVFGTKALAPGDVILALDGVSARELVEQAESLVSGSPQWKRARAMGLFGMGKKGSLVRITVREGEASRDLELKRGRAAGIPPEEGEAIRELEGGVYYVDLSRAEMPAISERIQALAAAPGVIFDLRGYPNGNHGILQHLTDRTLESAHWMVPHTVYPDRERIAGYDRSGRWRLEPAEPRLGGRIVWLCDASAISYAESVMGIVEFYGLGEIVGEASAGTNGNVNVIKLPGGYQISWTGMRVEKNDGSQHHLMGIAPTVPVSPTIRGIREGRDEQLEAALAIAQGH